MNINGYNFFIHSLPLSIIVGAGLVTLTGGLFVKGQWGLRLLLFVSLLGIGGAFGASAWLWGRGIAATASMLTVDPFSFFLYLILLMIGFLTCLSHHEYLGKQRVLYPEVYPLTLFALSGMMLMVSTTHLLVFFLGLEVMSLAIYVLVGFKRRDLRSNEAAMKYFILGAMIAGFFLYGLALIYGTTGEMDLKAITLSSVSVKDLPLFKIGVFLVLVAFAFKVAAVPFHFWTPDVYEGAPLSVTAFMATAVKTAAFGAFLRVLMIFVPVSSLPLEKLLFIFSLATMIVGNLIALYQTNVKRMLAYSSIAHAGYLLVGVSAAYAQGIFQQEAMASAVFYLLAYGVMTLGAFAVASAIADEKEDCVEGNFYSGLSTRSPGLAAAMALFMVGLTGIPPTVGFAGKFFIFREALDRGLYSLVVTGVVMSAISAYYYLRVVVAMYFGDLSPQLLERRAPVVHGALVVVILFCVATTLYLGLVPSDYLQMSFISGFRSSQATAIYPLLP